MTAPSEHRASVIIPAKDPGPTLEICLNALRQQVHDDDEIIVVDDHSTPPLAGATLHCPPGRRGAAAARHLGAEHARGRVLVVLDADVELLPGALDHLLSALDAPEITAAIGVYTPCPPDLGLISRFKDASVRLNHARGGPRPPWFWTALGAVRTPAFQAINGFDELRFRAATVEDMDLGYRLSAQGLVVVQQPEARARHHHRLGARDLLANDLRKSRDWTRTLLRHGPTLALHHGSTHPGALLKLAADARTLRAEAGAAFALSYLGLRALTLPVAVVGATIGLVGYRP